MDSALRSSLADLPTRCLVGVSGGIDSVALLHALVAAGKKPIVLHFNHGWRGAASTTDAKFVEALAKKLGVKFVGGKARAVLKKTEQSARAARWNFFATATTKFRYHNLILAHNADDQVETFLLQLLRGGGSGARGMRACSRHGKLTVHRPWLGVWRTEITAYAKANKLRWREDSTNADTSLRRNRLRHRLIPYLQKNFSPDAPKALWRTAEILGAEGEWLDMIAASSGIDPSARELSVRALRPLPVAQVRRLVRTWLTARGVPDIGFVEIESVRRLLTERLPAKVNLPGARAARRREGKLFVESI